MICTIDDRASFYEVQPLLWGWRRKTPIDAANEISEASNIHLVLYFNCVTEYEDEWDEGSKEEGPMGLTFERRVLDCFRHARE